MRGRKSKHLNWSIKSAVPLFVTIGLMLCKTHTITAGDKSIVGRIEIIRIYPGNLDMRAKIDTGAKTSSLGCKGITAFERNGQKWVRFIITNHKADTVTLERKVIRTATIKRHFFRKQERMVVKIGICLGDIFQEAEVTLVDRSGFNYQMLIGRTFIIDNGLIVDPSLKFTTRPKCKGVPAVE